MIDLDKLETLAKGATPGPWENSVGYRIYSGMKNIANSREEFSLHKQNESDISREAAAANAAYIAAANPAVVLKLIAMCRRLHWTTEKPTKPAYYWYKDDTEDGLLNIAYIYGDQDSGMFCNFVGEKEPTPLDLVTGEWAGPILEPEELEDD